MFIDKYRASGFQDTPLDSVLRYRRITTLLLAGVNADQCVMGTLRDAGYLGYDTVLVDDCIATTSPRYCLEATLYNAKIIGCVTGSANILKALERD